jgi:hypothetical protein
VGRVSSVGEERVERDMVEVERLIKRNADRMIDGG